MKKPRQMSPHEVWLWTLTAVLYTFLVSHWLLVQKVDWQEESLASQDSQIKELRDDIDEMHAKMVRHR